MLRGRTRADSNVFALSRHAPPSSTVTGMNVLLVDDEPLARRRMRRMLAEAGNVVVVAECGSGTSALEALRSHQVDLVFLDIQMPGVDGFVVAESLNGPDAPMVVFVTAHDTHAIRAFETRALDYLLKPVRAERLAAALTRARETMAARRSAAYAVELRNVIARLDQAVPVAATAPAAHTAARIEVRDGERVRYIDADDVAWAEAHGAHVKLHTKRGTFEIRETLAHVESSLDPRRFVRIHRSYLVNVSQIRELEPWFGGDAVLHLQDGQRLKVSRTYRALLKQRLNAL
jgi:two-component system, LytTR family, response regulator